MNNPGLKVLAQLSAGEISREAAIAALVELGDPPAHARYMVALELGDVSGDVIEIDPGEES